MDSQPPVTFTFTVPGQPVSWNHAYGLIRGRRRDGSSYMTMKKLPGVEPYQLVASTIARKAMPAGWEPAGQVIVRYWFHVSRDIDASNCLKTIEDAIAIGLGVNDRIFLPQVMGKTIGNKEPHTIVEIEG